MKISLMVAAHKKFDLVPNEFVMPIQVGAALTAEVLFETRDSDSPDNISHLNPFFCELTAQYIAWKNDETSDFVGLMHYRRYLALALPPEYEETIHGYEVESLNRDFLAQIGLDEVSLKQELSEVDMIVPRPFDVRLVGFKSIQRHYIGSVDHHEDDWDSCEAAVKLLSPELYIHWMRQYRQHDLYAGNMFIMKRELFMEYSQLVFSILSQVMNLEKFDSYTTQGKRVLGYLSERILSCFIKMKLEDSETKIKEAGVVFVKESSAAVKPLSLPEDSKTVVVATDGWYFPHAVNALTSAASKRSKPEQMDFVILHSAEISLDQKRRAKKLLESFEGIHLHFLDMGNSFKEMRIHSHFATPTYFRLMLPAVISGPSKVLYLDSDTVCNRGWDELFQIQLGTDLVGGVRDLIMETFCKKGVPADLKAGGQPAATYLNNIGVLSDNYVQAGVLLFNLEEMEKSDWVRTCFDIMDAQDYWFLDQDIINIASEGRKCFVPHVFNSVPIPRGELSYLSLESLEKYASSRTEAKILHFAGSAKPWDFDDVEFSDIYFDILRNSPFYEEVLTRRMNRIASQFAPTGARRRNFRRSIRLKIGAKAASTYFKLPMGVKSALNPVAIQVNKLLFLK
jgi:lipopolysaccharide biosynthesis glycosyltransferase